MYIWINITFVTLNKSIIVVVNWQVNTGIPLMSKGALNFLYLYIIPVIYVIVTHSIIYF